MPSQYPAALDNLPATFAGTDQANVVDHAGMHNDERQAINAVQAELGTDPSGAAATVRARLDAIDTDSRWSNSRTPNAHQASHAIGGSDALTAADIGAATTAQGAKADTAVQPALVDAKGDLLVGTADNTLARLPVGTNGQFLVADSSRASGLLWTTGGYGAKTSNYTLDLLDTVIAADTTSGAVTLTLPAASGCAGKLIRIIKTAGESTLTVSRAGSDTILPASGTRTQVTFPSGATSGDLLLVSTGAAWHVIEGRASDETVGRRVWEWAQALAATSTVAATGWQTVVSDTGWRDVLTLCGTNASGAVYLCMIRRRGVQVDFTIGLTITAILTNFDALTAAALGSGFAPQTPKSQLFYRYSGLADSERVLAYHDSSTIVRLTTSGVPAGNIIVSQSWTTPATWLSSLPGTTYSAPTI